MSSINRKTQYWKIIMLACGLAAILLGVIFAWIVRLESAISILAWPFIKTGEFLRSLSLRSEAGNILAILLYGGISLLPTGWIVLRKGRKGGAWILMLMSLWLFYMMWNCCCGDHLLLRLYQYVPV